MRDWVPGGRRILVAALFLLALGTAGCGRKLNTVSGTVTLADGQPLTRGLVVFEGVIDGTPVSARGEVKPDGSFRLGTFKPDDGVPAGKYRVLINPLDVSETPDELKNIPFDYKYLQHQTSGLEFEVQPGANVYPIKLDPPRRRR